MSGSTSPAAILLITDSFSRVIGFGSEGAFEVVDWSSGITNHRGQVAKTTGQARVRDGATVRDSYLRMSREQSDLRQVGESEGQVVKW